MANPARGEVAIEIGGKERTLRYDLNAVAEMEGHLGAPIMKVFSGDNIGLREVRALLYFGLHGSDPSLTMNKINDMFETPKLGYYMEQIGEAIRLFFGAAADPEDGEESKNPPTA